MSKAHNHHRPANYASTFYTTEASVQATDPALHKEPSDSGWGLERESSDRGGGTARWAPERENAHISGG